MLPFGTWAVDHVIQTNLDFNYVLRYLTPMEQEARGPQGLVSANMLSDNSVTFEEVIFNDETFGKCGMQ